MSPSIYLSIRESASQNKASPCDRSSNSFFGLGTLIKYKIYYLSIYLSIYLSTYLPIYLSIYLSIYAADRGSLEFDSRVLGDLVLPLIVWYMFSIIYFASQNKRSPFDRSSFFWLGTSIKFKIYYIYVLQLIWVLWKGILGSFQIFNIW